MKFCISTAGFDKLGGFQKDKESEMLEGIPLQRFGTKWDIAMACIYLAGMVLCFLFMMLILLIVFFFFFAEVAHCYGLYLPLQVQPFFLFSCFFLFFFFAVSF